MDRQIDVRIDEWNDASGRMDGQTIRRTHRTDGLLDRRMGRQTDGRKQVRMCTDGRVDRQLDGQADRQIDTLTDGCPHMHG